MQRAHPLARAHPMVRALSLALIQAATLLATAHGDALSLDRPHVPFEVGAGTGSPTCALDASQICPLPPWPATYNLSKSSIMYQPWCGGGSSAPFTDCAVLLNTTTWYAV